MGQTLVLFQSWVVCEVTLAGFVGSAGLGACAIAASTKLSLRWIPGAVFRVAKYREGPDTSFATQVFGSPQDWGLHAPNRPLETPIPLTGPALPLSANELSRRRCGGDLGNT